MQCNQHHLKYEDRVLHMSLTSLCLVAASILGIVEFVGYETKMIYHILEVTLGILVAFVLHHAHLSLSHRVLERWVYQ
jgi:hypothetical protein